MGDKAGGADNERGWRGTLRERHSGAARSGEERGKHRREREERERERERERDRERERERER